MTLENHHSWVTLPTTSREYLDFQLRRYAQDLQDLMGQYITLQQRHQQMLETFGSGTQGEDVLQKAMLQPTAVYLITNNQGKIDFVSPAADRILGSHLSTHKSKNILQYITVEQGASIQTLFDSCVDASGSGAVHQRKLLLRTRAYDGEVGLFDALIMPVYELGQIQLYWFLSDDAGDATDALNILKAFPFFESGNEGVLITDQQANISAVNRMFTLLTGYDEADLIGQNPRQLGSGLQDADFYKTFWHQLNTNGHWSGDLFNRRKSGQIYFAWMTIKAIKNEQNETLCYIAAFNDKSTRNEAAQQLPPVAFHDPLTGLPNRRLLEHRLNVAMADPSFKKTGLYVLLIDLNRLQTICDELGQNAGDQVLCEVSARLQSSVRRADTVAHIKGGEFVVVLTGIPHQADAQSVANAILIKLTSSVTLGSQRLGLEVNIGAAAFPRDGDNVVSLLKHAQAALQEAKILGSHLSFYENMPLPTDKQNPTFLSVFVPAYQTQQSQLK